MADQGDFVLMLGAEAPRPGASLTATGSGRRVLVVDDEPLNREIYRQLLQGAGYEVELAGGGLEAIEKLAAAVPALVLLDLHMPDLDGTGVLRWMREQPTHRETAAVLLTSSGESADIAASFDAGADDYLLKPVDARILLARMQSILAARESSRRVREAMDRERREVELREHLLSELEEARAVQRAQLPSLPARVGEGWLSGCVVPCGHVGGDIVDVLQQPDGSAIVFVVDVAGHGTGAALVASAIRYQFRQLLAANELHVAVSELSSRLLAEGATRHACVAAAHLRGREFSVVNAGMPPVWVGPRTGPRLVVESSGPPPGLFESGSYRTVTGELEPGEFLVMVSDGLTEPFGFADELGVGVPRLLAALPELGPAPPSAFARGIRGLFEGEAAGQPDDATIVVVGGL